MNYLLFMSVVLLLGTVILMVGNLIISDPKLSRKEVFGDSIVWGFCFLSSFAVEFIILGNT